MDANADRELPELARQLVAVPSHEDERAAGEVIADWLRAETDAVVTHDDHGVLARRGPGAAVDDAEPWDSAVHPERDGIALVGHHDVVPPADEQVDGDGYVVTERDGRLYGRGTADMKGSVAAAMLAVRDTDAPVTFVSFVGEEQGGIGARGAIEAGFAPDRAVVCEGSTNYSAEGVTDVVVAHRGRRGSTVTARGAAAHASEPEAGENAVYRALDAVSLIRELPAPETTVLGHPVEGSVVVTGIEGGTAMNIVPERCTVTVDERTVPGERAALERVETVAGVGWTVDQDLPPMACEDRAFADAMLTVAREVQADAPVDPQHVTKPHATDAGWLAGAGTACLVVGASEPGEAHTATESVSFAVLERCRRCYAGVVERVEGGL